MPEAIRNKIATYYGDYLYTEIDKYLQKYKNDGVPIALLALQFCLTS